MAVSLRELFLIIRAEDHASRQLRTVSGSLRALSKASSVAEQTSRMRARSAEMGAAIDAKAARAASMQQAILQKQKDKGLFSRENLNMQRQQNINTRTAAVRQQELNNFLKRRGTLEKQIRDDVASTIKVEKDRAREALRAEGLAGPKLQSRMRSLGTKMKASGAAMEAVEIEKLNLAEEKLRLGVDRADQAIARQDVRMSKATSSQAAFAAGIDRDRAALASLQHQIARDRAEWAEFERERMAFARNAPRIEKAQRGIQFGRGLAAAGRTAMFAGGAGAVGLGFAASAAARLQTEVSLAATQAVTNISQVAQKTEQVNKGILAQMQRFPAAADDMAKSIYDIFSGTNIQNSRKGLELMALFNKAAVAGQSDLNTATQGGLTVMNAYNKQVGDMPGIMNKMFAAVRFGRTNFTDFNQSLNQLVPAFISAHQSIDTMFGSLAFLTRRMPSVRQASVSLARATEILGNTKMVKGLHKMGVEIADVRGNLLPLPTVLGRILQKFPGLAKGDNVMNWIKDISNQQGTIQGRRALTHLFASFPQYQKILQQTTGDTREFTRSYKVMSQTPQVKFNVAVNQLKAIGLTIGHDALPAITTFLEKFGALGRWFHGLSPGVKQATASFAVWGSAILLVGGALGMLVGNLMVLVNTMKLAAIAGAGTKAIEGMVVAFRSLAAVFAAEGLLASLEAFGALLAGAPFALPVAIAAGILALGAAFVIFGDDVKNIPDRINDVSASLDKISKDPAAHIHTLNNDARRTNQLFGDLGDHMRTVRDQTQGAGWKGMQVLNDETKKASGNMKELKQQTMDEFQMLVKVADQGKKIGKHEAGLGAAAMARQAGLGAASQQQVAFASRMTGRLPTTDMLGAIKTYKNRAAVLFAQVAQSAHHMMTGHELDNAMALNQNKLVKFVTFVQRHRRLPKWFLNIDTKKAERDTKKAHGDVKKMGRDAGMMKVKANVADAESKMAKARDKALKLTQHKWRVKIDANTGPLVTALSSAEAMTLASGARAALAFHKGWDSATQSKSPSKTMEKRGKWLIQGLSKGIVKEAGGAKAAIKTITQAMESQWSEFHDSMQSSFGTLFQGPRADIISNIIGFGAKPGIGLLTQDLRGQVHKFTQWMHAVDRLRSMGAPPGLVSQLWELGPDSLPAVQSILAGTRKQRRTYFRLFRREDRVVTSATQRAFLNQSRIWNQMGKRMAFGLLTGLHTARPELLRFFKQLAHEMFHVFKKHNKSHSPSRLYFEEGRNMMLGLQAGINSVAVGIPGPVGFSGRGGGGARHTHYHYHAPAYNAGPSAQGWMKKSRFDFERHIKRLPK